MKNEWARDWTRQNEEMIAWLNDAIHRFDDAPIEYLSSNMNLALTLLLGEREILRRECAELKEQVIGDIPLEALDLPVRPFKSLKRSGFYTVESVIALFERGTVDSEISPLCHFGEKGKQAVVDKLVEKGYVESGKLRVKRKYG